jgi:hypothetical protein
MPIDPRTKTLLDILDARIAVLETLDTRTDAEKSVLFDKFFTNQLVGGE